MLRNEMNEQVNEAHAENETQEVNEQLTQEVNGIDQDTFNLSNTTTINETIFRNIFSRRNNNTSENNLNVLLRDNNTPETNEVNEVNERNGMNQRNGRNNFSRRYGRNEIYDIRNYTGRNRHRYNPRPVPSNHIDFRELIGLTLTNSILQDPLFQFTNIIKKNAANKIIKWYKAIKKRKQFIDR